MMETGRENQMKLKTKEKTVFFPISGNEKYRNKENTRALCRKTMKK